MKEEYRPPAGAALTNECKACGGDLTPFTTATLLPPFFVELQEPEEVRDPRVLGQPPRVKMMRGRAVPMGILLLQPLRCPYCESPMFYREEAPAIVDGRRFPHLGKTQ